MKIILSRKGFDSSIQGGGSPNIIYNNNPYMIPIPEVGTGIYYRDLKFENNSLLKVMRDLNINQYSECHFDPFIDKDIAPDYCKNWHYNLGQVDSAQSILEKEKIGVGDLFLFFGWFKKVIYDKKRELFKYVKLDNYHPEGIHLIYGYLEIGEILKVNTTDKLPNWTRKHPHVIQKDFYSKKYTNNNTIYVASGNFTGTNLPGAGMLTFNEELVLTKKGSYINKKGEMTYYTRTKWDLPNAFLGSGIKYLNSGKVIHENYIQAAPRGQEFVVLNDFNGKIKSWANSIIEKY